MEPISDTVTGRDRRPAQLGGRALGYQRSILAGPGRCHAPEGWAEISLTSRLGEGTALFDVTSDDLLGLDAHCRAGFRLVGADPGLPSDVDLLDGPMRGPCRVVDRTDESLRQGLVFGTLEGNPAVAEHRCHVDLDPDTGAVTATVRTTWRPGSAYVLPGAGRREARAYRRMGQRLVRALGACRAPGSGVVGP